MRDIQVQSSDAWRRYITGFYRETVACSRVCIMFKCWARKFVSLFLACAKLYMRKSMCFCFVYPVIFREAAAAYAGGISFSPFSSKPISVFVYTYQYTPGHKNRINVIAFRNEPRFTVKKNSSIYILQSKTHLILLIVYCIDAETFSIQTDWRKNNAKSQRQWIHSDDEKKKKKHSRLCSERDRDFLASAQILNLNSPWQITSFY